MCYCTNYMISCISDYFWLGGGGTREYYPLKNYYRSIVLSHKCHRAAVGILEIEVFLIV